MTEAIVPRIHLLCNLLRLDQIDGIAERRK